MKKQFKEIHILYAEDNPDEIVLMKEALNDVGQSGKLNVVRDGQEAIDYLTDTKNTRPDLMILDLNMPKVSGIEVLEFIKTNQKTKVIPVIILQHLKAQMTYKAPMKIMQPATLRNQCLIKV